MDIRKEEADLVLITWQWSCLAWYFDLMEDGF